MADGLQSLAELQGKNAGVTPIEIKPASSPGSQSGHSQSAGSRHGSTPGSVGKSPQKGAYWFACANDGFDDLISESVQYRQSPECYWFAHAAEIPIDNKPSAGSGDGSDQDGRDSAGLGGLGQKDREERLRLLRERQTEERQRRLDELRHAALHAQKVREQQEEERRRKIEELRHRDHERRSLVEERKKQIWEAELERKEAILRKNMEREARIEAKRNAHRSSIGFAFGSSTPRMWLEGETPTTGGSGGLFSNRRTASQMTLSGSAAVSNGRHSVERELIDSARKHRTNSTFGLDQKTNDSAYHSAYEAFRWSDHPSNSTTTVPALTPTVNLSFVGQTPLNTAAYDSFDSRATFPHKSESTVLTPTESYRNSDFLVSLHRPDRFAGNLTGSGVFVEDLMTKSMSAALSGPPTRGRRKTDLVPTVPLYDSPRNHSPGRAYSMTRLDQLAAPRRRLPLPPRGQSSGAYPPSRGAATGNSSSPISKTKSMIHLAGPRTPRGVRGHDGSVLSPRPLQSSRNASKSMSYLASRQKHGTYAPPQSPPKDEGANVGAATPIEAKRSFAKSMLHLASPSTPFRPTRTSQLRASNALARAQMQGMSKSMVHLGPKKKAPIAQSDDAYGRYKVTRTSPSSPSRPNSSMSQQSLSSHASQSSGVSLRARSGALNQRRPRPVSIAGTAPDVPGSTAALRQGRSTERKPVEVSAPKPPRAKSVGSDRISGDATFSVASKPPIAAPRKTPRPPSSRFNHTAATGTMPKEKPKIPPKPTSKVAAAAKPTPKQSALVEQAPQVSTQVLSDEGPKMEQAHAPPPESVPPTDDFSDVAELLTDQTEPVIELPPSLPKMEELEKLTLPPPPIPQPTVVLVSETGGVVPSAAPATEDDGSNDDLGENNQPLKPRITTETEAKAAMAERRRLAREQAEREAELERQRQEELRRQEEELLQLEEEERKRWEEEQNLLRRSEEDRVQRAIEEQMLKEEEERKRREEEAKLKIEKEEQDRKAREEQEKLRKETEERLRKEEEDRAERRKRVEAIMSRTRGGKPNSTNTPVTTPTKNVDKFEDDKISTPSDEEAKAFPSNANAPGIRDDSVTNEDRWIGQPSPTDEGAVVAADVTSAAVTDIAVLTAMASAKTVSATLSPDLLGDIVALSENGNRDSSNNLDLSARSSSPELISTRVSNWPEPTSHVHVHHEQPTHTNGYSQNGLDRPMDFNLIVESKSDKRTSDSRVDPFAEFETLKPRQPPSPPPTMEFEQLIDLGSVSGSALTTTRGPDFLNNEDSVNSNIPINGPGAPFIAFEDNFTKKQETNITDLLS